MDLIKKGVLEIAGRAYPVLIDNITHSVNSVYEGCMSFSGNIVNCDKLFKLSAPFPGDFLVKAFNLPKPTIKNVVFNDPATVVMWSDGTKTVVKCQPGDVYSKETGLALCIAKKFLGNKSNFNEVFKQWIPEENEPVEEMSVKEMRCQLEKYCAKRECADSNSITCPLYDECSCEFLPNTSRIMTDDEIRRAYKIVFKGKEK